MSGTATSASAPAGSLLPSGYLSTQGNQIVDANGTPVRIASIGWNQNFTNIPSQVAAMKAAGFNTIRVSWVNATMADDLNRIDQVVAAAKATGMKVILDNHTNEPGSGPQDNWGAQQKNGLWYDVGGASNGTDGGGNHGTVTDAKFQSDWVTVAQHYQGNDTVIGFDIRNEPLAYGGMCTWGDGNLNTDIRLMYQRVGNAVQAVDPGKLIICEGPQNYNQNFAGTGPAPWGDLSLAGSKPVALNTANKVVYSIHDYPREIAGYSPDNGATKVAQMNAAWGYLVKENVAPVWIGEMGSSMQDSTDQAWASTLLDYMNGKAAGGPTFTGNQQGISGDWWAWGNLPGQLPNGTQNADGSLKADQKAVWSQMLYTPASGGIADPITKPTPVPVLPASPDNTVIKAGSSDAITDAAGNKWTITANGQVAVNGVADATTGRVVTLAYEKGQVWQENADKLWWSKSTPTDQWGPPAGTVTSPVPASGGTTTPTPDPVQTPDPTPTPSASPDNTVVKAGSSDAITDAAGNKWTITANGQVAVNGVADATTGRVTMLAYEKGQVWQENADKLWWSKSAPTDQWGPPAGTATSPIPASGGTAAPDPTTPAPTPTTDPTPIPSAGPGTWQELSLNGMQYNLLLPAGYDPAVKYPVVLFLHQLNNASQIPTQIDPWFNSAAFRSAYPAIVVAPKLDMSADPSGNTINWGGVSANVTDGGNKAIAIVKQVIAQYAVDPGRVYVTGDSMGGIGTWDMMIKYNAINGTEGKIFAAGMPLAGATYDHGYPTPDPAVVAELKNVPIWAVHGANDGSVPTVWDRAMANALKGSETFHYTEDPNLGHDVWDTYYPMAQGKPLYDWLFAQRAPGSGGVSDPTKPTPTPDPSASPDNTVIKAGSSDAITDAAGNKWTITANGQVAVNGVADATTGRVVTLAYEKGQVWQENADKLWWSKSAPTDQWGPPAGTATSPVPASGGTTTPTPPTTPSASPDNTVVKAGSSDAITDAAGNKWTITANGQVAVNGVADATTGRVITLAYEKGQVWQENADKLWWSKSAPTDQWGPPAGTATSPIPASGGTATPDPTPTPTPSAGVIGSGSDTLVLRMSEDADGPVGAAGRDAQFTVNVDGKQIGGLQTVTAARAKGETQTFTFKGNFAPGQHKVTVTFANNSMTQGDKAAFNDGGDRNLYVNGVTYNGQTVSSTTTGIYTSPLFPPNGPLDLGNAVFTVTDTTAVPAGAPSTPTTTPAPVSFGTGPDTLTLMMSEDPFQGDAQFTVSVDGKQVGGTFTTTAVSWQGQQQQFDLHGAWGSGSHAVVVNFVNDAIGATDSAGNALDAQDRNLYVNGIAYNGTATPGTPWELPTNGPHGFTVSGTTPTPSSPPKAGAAPSITITTASGSQVVNADKAGTVKVAGNTISLTAPGVASVAVGTTAETLKFIGMSQVKLTGSSAKDTIVADGGTNTWTAGKGALTITGGAGADNYVYHAGSGLLTIADFKVAQGDVLTIDKALKGSMHQASDGHGGTMLSFGSAAAGIDVKGLTAIPASGIHWA